MPMPPIDSAAITRLREVRPTELSSRRIRDEWDAKIKAHSVFSARTANEDYLRAVKQVLVETSTRQITPQQAERKLLDTLQRLGYTPETGFAGDRSRKTRVPFAKRNTMSDLSSSRRIQLIVDTNVKQARSFGQMAASEDPMILYSDPAWRLTRTGARKKPRGTWPARWKAAGEKVGWSGALKNRMVALKTSPIWQAIGDGTGGYEDTLGSSYPPFAFGSGMAWVSVSRREWIRMCAAEGAPDGLEAISQKAREMSRGEGLYRDVARTAENPLVVGTPAPVALPEAGAVERYAPDWSAQDRANTAVDAALDAAKAAQKAAEEAVAAVAEAQEKAISDGLGESVAAARLQTYLEKLGAAKTKIAELYGRIVNYGGRVEALPPPTSAADQRRYDDEMKRLERAARLSGRTAAAAGRTAKIYAEAARRTIRKASGGGNGEGGSK